MSKTKHACVKVEGGAVGLTEKPVGGSPRVVVSTAAFHARVRGSVPGLGGLKETKIFLPQPRVKLSIVGSLRDREVACSASERQGSNFESCVWRTVSSHSSHHPQEVLLAQFGLYVHKGGLKPDLFHLEKPAALLRWMVAGPEMARVVGNPFMDTSGYLLVLDSRVFVDSTVVDRKCDRKCVNTFFKDRLAVCIRPVSDTVTKANIRLFCSRQPKEKLRGQKQLIAMKLNSLH